MLFVSDWLLVSLVSSKVVNEDDSTERAAKERLNENTIVGQFLDNAFVKETLLLP